MLHEGKKQHGTSPSSFSISTPNETKIESSVQSSTRQIKLVVSLDKSLHHVTVNPSAPLSSLRHHLDHYVLSSSSSSSPHGSSQVDMETDQTDSNTDMTTVKSSPNLLYKIIYKGKTFTLPGPHASTPLDQLGFTTQRAKVVVIATFQHDVTQLDQEVAYLRRRDDPSRRTQPVPRHAQAYNTSSSSRVATLSTTLSSSTSFGFERIEALPGDPVDRYPFLDRRQNMLRQLSQDPAILSVMKERNWKVETLGELHPWTDPMLLGVNENRGMRIRLRLLTDRLDGLRAYKMVRRVLIHELAHMQFGPHDDNFKTLDSSLTKQVESHDRHQTAYSSSGHRLRSDLDLAGGLQGVYEPPEVIEQACTTSTTSPNPPRRLDGRPVHIPGQGSVHGEEEEGMVFAVVEEEDESVEERRRRLAEAATKRTRRS